MRLPIRIIFHYYRKLQFAEITISYKDQPTETTIVRRKTTETLNLYNAVQISASQILPNLWYLDLQNNKFDDIPNILSFVPNLKYLFLVNNKLFKIPVLNIPRLEKIFLEYNAISDLSPLSNYKNLETIIIYNNNISDISPLLSLPNLRELNVSHNEIENFISLFTIPKLKELTCRGNSKILYFQQIVAPNLIYLDLSYNGIDCLELSKIEMPNLEYLHLKTNYITDMNFLKLMKLTKLKILWLSDNNIGEFVDPDLPSLEELYISNNYIADISNISSFNMPLIRILVFGYNDISDISVFASDEMIKFTKLENVMLNDNKIKNALFYYKKIRANLPNLKLFNTAGQKVPIILD